MDNEERYIKERLGDKNPFVVPEGYFDQLADSVMSRLPERKTRSRFAVLRPWLYAAACIVAVVVMALSFHFDRSAASGEPSMLAGSADNTYIEEAADYAMLDNDEIYACLADN